MKANYKNHQIELDYSTSSSELEITNVSVWSEYKKEYREIDEQKISNDYWNKMVESLKPDALEHFSEERAYLEAEKMAYEECLEEERRYT